MYKLIKILILMLSMAQADASQDYDSEYGAITDYMQQIAKTMSDQMVQNQLTENEMYVMLASLVSYDARIWSAAIAFNPIYLNESQQAAEKNSWHIYSTKHNQKRYAPYVWREENNLLHADNIANVQSKFNYDYTDGQWAWWTDTIQAGKAKWSKPVYSNLTGHHMISYSYPLKRDAVLTFNVYHRA